MASYYYLISSLPVLKADAPQPLNYNEFLGMCKTNVGTSVYSLLEGLTVSSENGPLLSEWAGFHRLMQEELRYQRNLRLGRPCSVPYNRDPQVSGAVTAAMAEENPLKGEQILLDLEFRRLDEMVGLHNFDDVFLFGYALKLQLLERQNVFDHDAGSSEFHRLFENIQQQIRKI